MCLLVLQKENTSLTLEELNNANDANPDGIGYAYVNDGKLITRKFRKYKKFLNGYSRDIKMYSQSSPFLLHFRLATHGVNSGVENVHPFKVRENLIFAHNGVIYDVSESKIYSDTQMLNFEILQKLDKGFLKNLGIIKLLSEFVSGSKLVFLNDKKEFNIINEHSGHWNENKTIWFSNSGYKKREIYSYGGYSYNRKGTWFNPYKATQITKPVETTGSVLTIAEGIDDEMPQCEWCGMESGDLKSVDVTDYYTCGDLRDTIIADLCPECSKQKTDEDKLLGGGNDIFTC